MGKYINSKMIAIIFSRPQQLLVSPSEPCALAANYLIVQSTHPCGSATLSGQINIPTVFACIT